MKKVIIINASDLAACVGRNPFKSQADCVQEYFARFLLPKGAPAPMTKRKRTEDAFEALKETAPETYTACVTALRAPLTTSVDVLEQAGVTEDALKKNAAVSDEVRADIISLMKNSLFTRFGTEQEEPVRAAMPDRPVKTDAFVKRLLYSDDEYDVYVGGRCDGVVYDEDGAARIIEIKNRIRRLYNNVPEYERVQLMAYLYINNVERGELVERHRANVARHEVSFDPSFWEGITADARRFVECLTRFGGDAASP